jgi:hypothetical protein
MSEEDTMIDPISAAAIAQTRHDDMLREFADEPRLARRRWAHLQAIQGNDEGRETVWSVLRSLGRRRARVLEPQHST